MKKRLAYAVVLCASILTVSGCSIVPSQPDQAVYELGGASSAQRVGGAPSPYSLYVSTPYANDYLDTARIVVKTADAEMQVYKGARWIDRTPQLIRDSLSQAIRSSGLFSSVGNSVPPGKFLDLKLFINRFQVEYQDANTPVVVMDIDVNLVADRSSGQVISRHFSVRKPAADAQVNAIVSTFGDANQEFQQQLIAWLGSLLLR